MYGSESMLGKEKERSRIRAVQMDNLRRFLGIRGMDRVLNAQIRELCGGMKGVGKRIDEGVLRWFSNLVRMEKNRMLRESVLVVMQEKRFVRGNVWGINPRP